MPKKRHKPEEIVAKLRQVDVLTAQGRPVAEAVRSIGVTEVTYYRWRSEYGGLKGGRHGLIPAFHRVASRLILASAISRSSWKSMVPMKRPWLSIMNIEAVWSTV